MVDTKQTKTVGEHWVCSALARRGWAPALTRDGVERTDILAVDTTAGHHRHLIEVQVKAATGTGQGINWPLGRNSQKKPLSEHEWFVLVAIDNDESKPLRSFVLPRSHVAAAAWISHMNWRTEPGIEAGKRNAEVNRSRVALPVFERYEDQWDSLSLATSAAPVLLPSIYRDYALETSRVGLPPDHPWRQSLPEWE